MAKIESFKWLEERDKEILKMLYFNRFMNTSQIEKIFFQVNTKTGKEILNKRIITNNRLRKLRDHNCIKSYFSSGNSDCIHTIAEAGVFIVAGMLGKVFNDLYFNPKGDYLAFSAAEHCLLLSDVFIRLKEEAEKRGGEIKEYKVEQLNYMEFDYQGKKLGIKPDVFLWYKPDKNKDISKLYYIEIDLDTETPNVFIDSKITKGYEPLYASKQVQNIYSRLFPHVITLCPSSSRIERLKRITNTKLKWSYLLYDELEKLLYM